jgi:membrane-anchored protein YejM (alkaline phosphatase superfamily)
VVDAALRWLAEPRGGPFFAWVHLFDPHAPYEPPPPYRERFASRLYDGEVAYADAQLARLLEWLDRSQLRDSLSWR